MGDKEDWKESWLGKSSDTNSSKESKNDGELEDMPKSDEGSEVINDWEDRASTVYFIFAFFAGAYALYKGIIYGGGINTYVGGDAYNFIINANKFVGWMVVALIFTLIGCTVMIVNAIQSKNRN